MKLRMRLAWTVLLTAAPAVAALAWMQQRAQWRAAEQSLLDFARERMANGGREQCEDNPRLFHVGPRPGPQPPRTPGRPPGPAAPGGPGPGRAAGLDPPPFANELWAYAADLRSANPRAPEFPAELAEAMRSGAGHASASWRPGGRRGIQVAVAMAWSAGPCAVVLARRPAYAPPGMLRDLLLTALVLCAVLLLAVLLATGPLVRRLRRLRAQVRESAAAHYARPVEVRGSDEVAELAATFNGAAAEVHAGLEAVATRERTLRRFVEDTMHDVMLPLTVLQGHLTALRTSATAGVPVDPQVAGEALQEAHYMASLLQNLAAAARLEGGAPELERHPFALAALVERAIGRHRPIARARQVALEHALPPEPLWALGDVTLVEQAISNLIHNAVRYVPPGGHVAVILEADGPGRFTLRVVDDGPGIPQELRERVLERAFRADTARSRHPGGLGLGLAIAQDVARRHGYTLTLDQPAPGGLACELRGPTVPPPPLGR